MRPLNRLLIVMLLVVAAKLSAPRSAFADPCTDACDAEWGQNWYNCEVERGLCVMQHGDDPMCEFYYAGCYQSAWGLYQSCLAGC